MSESAKSVTGFTVFVILIMLLLFAVALYYKWKENQRAIPKWRRKGDWDWN